MKEMGTTIEYFQIILNENYLTDYKSQSFVVDIISNPKRKFGIKKIKGYRRVIETGWEYKVKMIK